MLNNKSACIAVISVFLPFFAGCRDTGYRVEKIKVQHIEVTPDTPEDPRVAQFLAPYQDSLSALLGETMAYSPEYLAKNDRNGALGAWLGDLAMDRVGKYLKAQGITEPIDAALFNAGGERTSLPAGDVKRSFVYEFMPFENSYVLVKLRGEAMQEMFDYLSADARRGTFHPLGGINLVIRGTDGKVTARVGGKRFDSKKLYHVLTTDFLLKGGDNMNFFAKNEGVLDIKLKMRESIMDYLADTDTITIPKDLRYEIR